ncbi:hypothetical protein [Azospirillum argentinense]|uniref:hypothetical protein n=1 Tax=Azospirillum argentinense TaxID=2970906 RepID=UPI0032DEEDD7
MSDKTTINAMADGLSAVHGRELAMDATDYADGTYGSGLASDARAVLARLHERGWELTCRSSVQEAAPATAADGLTETANGAVQDCLTAIRDLASEMGHSDTLGFEEARERIIEHVEEALGAIEAAARAVPPAGVPEGWKLVPVEPTPEMLDAGVEAGVGAAPSPWCPEVYRALLSAAPTAPTAQGQDILWCAHVQGPDEVHPARDYDHAVEMCNMFNAISEQCNFGFKPDDIRYVRSVAYPAVWPWDAASHAEGLPSAPSAGEATKP